MMRWRADLVGVGAVILICLKNNTLMKNARLERRSTQQGGSDKDKHRKAGPLVGGGTMGGGTVRYRSREDNRLDKLMRRVRSQVMAIQSEMHWQ